MEKLLHEDLFSSFLYWPTGPTLCKSSEVSTQSLTSLKLFQVYPAWKQLMHRITRISSRIWCLTSPHSTCPCLSSANGCSSNSELKKTDCTHQPWNSISGSGTSFREWQGEITPLLGGPVRSSKPIFFRPFIGAPFHPISIWEGPMNVVFVTAFLRPSSGNC